MSGETYASNDGTGFLPLDPRNPEEKYVWVLERHINQHKSNNKYQCKSCNKIFCGGRQRIRIHITGVQEGSQQVAVCPQPSAEAIAEFAGRPYPVKSRPKKRKAEAAPDTTVAPIALEDVQAAPMPVPQSLEELHRSQMRVNQIQILKTRHEVLQRAIESSAFHQLSAHEQEELRMAWLKLTIMIGDLNVDMDITLNEAAGTESSLSSMI